MVLPIESSADSPPVAAPPAGPAHRYERKFLVGDVDTAWALSVLRCHPAMFREAYPPRWVNNLYLDTPDLRNYEDNLIGRGQRLKVRARWYHALYGLVAEPVLEFKVKRGVVGVKETFDLPPLQVSPAFSDLVFRSWLRNSPIPQEVLARLEGLRVALVNRYFRRYFVTPDGRFRITVDEHLVYQGIGRQGARLARALEDHQAIVVELKYEMAHERQAHAIASSFPFRPTRSSKYVMGIERVYQM